MSALPASHEGAWSPVALALRRAALAVAQPSGPTLFEDLVRELAASLDVPAVFVAVFEDDTRSRMRTLATILDGKLLRSFDYALAGSPCAQVVGHEFRYVGRGVAAEFPDGSLFGAKGMDAYAAYPLNDSAGTPLGLLVAMDRAPLPDPVLAEAMLKIFASRIAAELERSRADEALRAAALAVSNARSDSVFAELVRLLATILHVEVAFIARRDDDAADARPGAAGRPSQLRMIAMYRDGRLHEDVVYALAGTPCETVIGQGFRAYPSRLAELFPGDDELVRDGVQSYAGHPLSDLDGRPLGIVSVASRRPLPHIERVESMLQIFALRAAAELERLRADEALRRSEASYRAIFESAEDAIFIHDWDSGAIVDANPKACATYGYDVEELRRLSIDDVSAGGPYTGAAAQRHLQQARLGRPQRFEWHRRNKDGSLHWDEVVLKRATIDGRPSIVGFGRDISERKAAEEALKLREEQYRAVFEASSDAIVLRDSELRIVDVNPAFLRLTGAKPEDLATATGYPPHFPREFVEQRLAMLRRGLAGDECRVETTMLRADGTPYEAELRVIPVRYRGQPHVLSVVRDITERKQAENALKLREAQYRAVFDGSADALVLRDRATRIVDVNRAFEEIYGWSREEVIGHDYDSIPMPLAAGDRERLTGMVQRALAGAESVAETVATRKGGERFDVELRFLPIEHRGEPHALIVARDITGRKQAERALQAREEQYRAIFEASSDAFVLRDARLKVVDVNPAFVKLTGFTREDRDSDTGYPADFPPGHVAERHALIRRALAGETLQLEMRLLCANGRWIDADVRLMPLRYRGEPHVLSIVRDITERKEAERALQLREEQYRAIFDGATDAMALWSADIRKVDVNRAFLQMYGYARDEVIGQGFDHSLPPEDVERRTALIRRALAGEEGQLETVSVRKDGQPFDVELRYLPIRHRGEPHVLVIARDITARRRAETERAELEAQLRQAQKMEAIGQLTGGIAHDFNNILTSVIGYVVLASERAANLDDPKLSRQLDQVHLAAQRARDLIAQMMTFARRQRGERKAVQLPALVRQTAQLLRATLPSTIELDAFDADPDPEQATPPVQADAVQIEQVLFNLCINARDAIGERSGRIRVRLGETAGGHWHCASCRARVAGGRWVELSVADSGTGIAPDVLERMFDPFYTTKQVGRGSGMGLAMVHGIVHDHGGHLRVETQLGAGSTFRVLLPPADAPAGAAAAAAPAKPAVRPRLAGRILLVEDERMVGDFMTELLDGWGLQVRLERDPLQALAWLGDPANAIELLITDQTMPQLTGLQLAERARTLRPQLPIVLYTGNAGEIDPAELESRGIVKALRKPVDPEALRALVRQLLAAAGG